MDFILFLLKIIFENQYYQLIRQNNMLNPELKMAKYFYCFKLNF